LTVVDESGSRAYVLHSQSTMERKEVLDELRAVKAVYAPDWCAEDAVLPLYAFTCGQECEYLWSNGYLISPDGNAYRFDFDFASMCERNFPKYAEKGDPMNFLPGAEYIAKGESGWRTEFMAPSSRNGNLPEGMSTKLVSANEHEIIFEVFNDSGEEWIYGRGYSLEVLLDEQWFSVPTKSFSVPADATILADGDSVRKTVSLEGYGELPVGRYRVFCAGVSVEFDIQ